MKSKYWNNAGKGFSEKVIKKFRGRGVSEKALDKWLPDYIEGKEISALFEGKLTEGYTQEFYGFYKGKNIKFKSDYPSDAKKYVIDKFKVPKSKWGEVIILSKSDYDQQQSWHKQYNEGKLTEAKETIFDVATRVIKDSQMYVYQSKKGKVKVDMQTANLLTKVFKKINPKMKQILTKLGEDDPAQLVQTLWAVVK